MKIKIFTFGLVLMLIAISFATGFSVTKSRALGLGFGGHLVWWQPCTCSGGLWLFYAPQPNSSFPGGPLTYLPWATITYPYYNMITPGVWHLGTYIPGVQSCWIYEGDDCNILPSLGQEVMVGTSDLPTPFN